MLGLFVHVFICVTLFLLIVLGVELITHDMKIKEKNVCNTFTTSSTMRTHKISNFELKTSHCKGRSTLACSNDYTLLVDES